MSVIRKRDVFTLLSGNILAQAVPVLCAPIFSRIYSAADLGVFAVFQSVCLFAAVPATLRYSFALLLPDDESDAFNLLALCLISSAAFALLFGVALVPLARPLARMLDQPELQRWLWVVPIAALLSGVYLTLYTWANRQKRFKTMSLSKLLQSGGMSILAIVLGLSIGAHGASLILAYMLGQTLSIVLFWFDITRISPAVHRTFSWRRCLALAKQYSAFPLYGLPGALVGSFSNQLPVLMISSFFGKQAVGLFNWTFLVALNPLTMVSTAILDVFKEQAAREYSTRGNCRESFIYAFKALSAVVLPIFLIFLPLAPFLFEHVFGAQWRESGVYAQLLVPLFATRLISSPLSYVVYIAQKQHLDLIWQIVVLALVALSFIWGAYVGSIRFALTVFSFSYSFMYLVYLGMNYTFACGKPPAPEALVPKEA